MSLQTINMTPVLYNYLLKNSVREHPVLAMLRAETAKLPQAQMQISPEQGQFMSFLVKLMGAKKTLELGTFTGYSALTVALALPKEGKVIACDISDQFVELAHQHWERAYVSNKVELKIAPASDSLAALIQAGESNSFDFIFIDADKMNYAHYYEQSLILLRPGGIIAVDNVLWGGAVADPHDTTNSTQALQAFNEKLYYDERIELSMVPIGDGLTLALKK